MAKKIVVMFEGEVTKEQQESFDRFVKENFEVSENGEIIVEVFGFGGGVKNPRL